MVLFGYLNNMIEKKDVEKLAELSRIDISDSEKESLIKDMDAILGYVSEIQEVAIQDTGPVAGKLRNVMREDNISHEKSEFTEDILKEAPSTKDGYIKVKKIL